MFITYETYLLVLTGVPFFLGFLNLLNDIFVTPYWGNWRMYGETYYHVISDYRGGLDWAIGFIGLITTRNYGAIANSYSPQFTTARIKSFHSAVSSPCWVTSSNSGRSSAPGFTSSRGAYISQVTRCCYAPAYKDRGSSTSHTFTRGDCLRRPPTDLAQNS